MANINIDFNNIIGKIKPMHGVGQPPFSGTNFSMISYLKEAGIPYSRLHDVGGSFGGNLFVDIPNLFRDFNADPYNPASYDFAFTDLLITALVENGVEPFFRLGVTIENYVKVKAYRIYPPADFKKWAIICEHVIRHYTQGWANGFHYDIKYWEIWNEPDNDEGELNQMWLGTPLEFYELYDVAAKHLKERFPHLKIGGFASCGFYSIKDAYTNVAVSSSRTDYFLDFFHGFVDYIKEHKSPLDFFSWHTYDTDLENNRAYAEYAKNYLIEAGYPDVETSCNEWNCGVSKTSRNTGKHAAKTLAMMLMFQNSPLDNAMFYDARYGLSIYGSLFDPISALPTLSYYAFIAFNRLYALKNQVKLTLDDKDVYAVAAKGEKEGWLVISNTSTEDKPLSIKADANAVRCIITSENGTEMEIALPGVLPKESMLSVYFNM